MDRSRRIEGRAVSTNGILEVHARFCKLLLKTYCGSKNHGLKSVARRSGRTAPSRCCCRRHIPISPGALPRFLKRFEESYAKLGKTESIIATAAAHHRLLWMHPFLDGNGRVARLLSHAMLLEKLETGAAWSIARGLARNVQTYKSHLANCDQTRRNDLDGRGTLSQEALIDFTRFFMTTCLDQSHSWKVSYSPNGCAHAFCCGPKRK